MAGFYPDVPAHRFALDMDGTVFKKLDAAKTVLSDAQTASTLIGDTDSDYYELDYVSSYPPTTTRGYFVVIFPELRNIDAYFVAISGNYADSKELEYSSDTTDGMDGTWTTVTTNWIQSSGITPDYRNSIVSQPLTNVKSLRFGYGSNNGGYNVQYRFRIDCMHLYGSIVGGQNPDRLRFWHDTLDQEVGPAHFDFGDMAVGTQKAIQFRVKNNSSTLTANTITLSRESASYSEVVTGLEFSSDGINYFPTLSLSNLPPGGTSSIVFLRRSMSLGETTSVPKVGRVLAAADSWS